MSDRGQDASGHTLASLIAGNMEAIGDPNGAAGLFVRRPGENQSWLARAVFVPHGAPSDWMLLHVLDLDAARLKDITIAPPGAHALHPAPAPIRPTRISPCRRPCRNAGPPNIDAIPTALTSFQRQRRAARRRRLDFAKAVARHGPHF